MTKNEALEKIKELQEYVNSIPEKSPKTQLEEEIQKIFSSYNSTYIRNVQFESKIEDEYIYFELPSANKDWFFLIMDIAKKICAIKGYSIYPSGNIQKQVLKLVWTKNF